MTIPLRDVQVRDASSGEVAENTGIVRLPRLIIAFTDDSAGEGIEQARTRRAGPLVEVARVRLEAAR